MKLRITRRKLLLICIAIFFLSNIRFFYIPKLPSILSGAVSNVLLTSISAVLVFGVYILLSNFKINIGSFGYLILSFYFIVIVSMIAMNIRYHYSLNALIWSSIPFLILIMYFPVREYITLKNGWSSFVMLYEFIGIILCILLITQWLMYSYNGIVFLDISNEYIKRFQYITNGDSFLVYYVEGFLRILPIISFSEIVENKKNSFWHIVSLGLSLFAIVVVGKTRMYILSIIIAMFSMVFFQHKIKWNIRKILITALACIVLGIVLYQNIDSVFNTLNDSKDGSNYARMGAIKYYMQHFFEHPITGYGYVIPDKTSKYYILIKGNLGIYNFDDIGLLGIIASMGLLGGIWYIVVWFKMLLLCKRTKYKTVSIGLVTMMFVCMATLSYLDRVRIIDLTISMAIIDGTRGIPKYELFSNNNRL